MPAGRFSFVRLRLKKKKDSPECIRLPFFSVGFFERFWGSCPKIPILGHPHVRFYAIFIILVLFLGFVNNFA